MDTERQQQFAHGGLVRPNQPGEDVFVLMQPCTSYLTVGQAAVLETAAMASVPQDLEAFRFALSELGRRGKE